MAPIPCGSYGLAYLAAVIDWHDRDVIGKARIARSDKKAERDRSRAPPAVWDAPTDWIPGPAAAGRWLSVATGIHHALHAGAEGALNGSFEFKEEWYLTTQVPGL